MRKTVSLILASILLITCSGCLWGYDRGGYGEQDRRGYGDRDRGERGEHDRGGYGDRDRGEHEERH